MLSDVDAMTIGLAITADSTTRISTAVQSRYATSATSTVKYQEFVTQRFGSGATMLRAANAVFAQTSDVSFSGFRAALWQKRVGLDEGIGVALTLHPTLFEGIAEAFVDVIHDKYIG